MDQEFGIELVGDRREDGSVCVCSPDLPLFCVVGDDERDAFATAMKLLPEYLKANVPEFVELRTIKSARELLSPRVDSILPAHVIATTTKGRVNAAAGSSNDR
jgi:hypothetical protein